MTTISPSDERTMMELYVKQMQGKRTRYVPYVPPDNSNMAIPQEQMVTLLTTLTMSMLMSIEDQLPKKHSRFSREIRNMEDAISRLAKLNAKPLDPVLVNAGVVGWNAAIEGIQKTLMVV